MTRFWLTTFEVTRDNEQPVSAAATILPSNVLYVAVEVLRDRDRDEWAVLVSSVDNPQTPTSLSCLIGFANTAKACNVWLDRGFMLLDATIGLDADVNDLLRVMSSVFRALGSIEYDTQVIAIQGLGFDGRLPAGSAATMNASYQQNVQSPDAARPDEFIRKRAITWTPTRTQVTALSAQALAGVGFTVGDPPSRCPDLAFVDRLKPVAAWTGEIQVPAPARDGPGASSEPQTSSPVLGAPAFRFENVEILGFRIDLADLSTKWQTELAALVAPLNFHLADDARETYGTSSSAIPDFVYRAATSTVAIELLRYGRMKARQPMLPMTADDFQSQHELLVRILVGRVDEDGAQAHSPAVFVPAIFVDNSWSKVLGRDGVGYDKRLAVFKVLREKGPVPLRPDGRLTDRATKPGTEPLGDIAHIELVDKMGEPKGLPLLDLSYSSTSRIDPAALMPIDLDLTFGTSAIAGTRWRQSDFDAAEFRRSFATLAIAQSARNFRGIQVSPVGRRDFAPSWITSQFNVDPDVRTGLPDGVATLALHLISKDAKVPSRSSTPDAWNRLCRLLGGTDTSPAVVRVTGGNWYRLSCSMDLTIDDGLDFESFD